MIWLPPLYKSFHTFCIKRVDTPFVPFTFSVWHWHSSYSKLPISMSWRAILSCPMTVSFKQRNSSQTTTEFSSVRRFSFEVIHCQQRVLLNIALVEQCLFLKEKEAMLFVFTVASMRDRRMHLFRYSSVVEQCSSERWNSKFHCAWSKAESIQL